MLRCLKDSGLTAFFTRSSAANIPVNMELCRKLGLNKDNYSVSIPLGATINMDGTAIYMGVTSLFIATCYGIDLTLGNMLWFLEPALKFDFANLTTGTLPGRGDASYHGISVYELDIEGSLELINRCINPYTTDITADMVKMVRCK